jgi:YD repeat-containing protein
VQGNPLTVLDPRGQLTRAAWGYGHLLLSQTNDAGTVTHAAYTRNALGQVTQALSPAVTYTLTYDAAHRLATVRDSRGGLVLTHRWSPGGQLNSWEDSQGHRTDYAYDPVGRLAGIWAPNGDLVSFLYDAGGRLTNKGFPNGVATAYTWNPDHTLAQVLNAWRGSTLVSQHDYTYDGVGNRATHTENVAGFLTPYRYGYDPLNRLTEVRNSSTGALLESYTYDPLGNRTSKTNGATLATTAYLYDPAHQLTEIRQGTATRDAGSGRRSVGWRLPA